MVAPVLPAETMARRLAVADRLGGPDERRVLLACARCGRRRRPSRSPREAAMTSRSPVSPSVRRAGRPAPRACRARRRPGRAPATISPGGLVAAHGVDGDREHGDGPRAFWRLRRSACGPGPDQPATRRRWPGGRGTSRSCRTRRGAAWRRCTAGTMLRGGAVERPGRGPAAAALRLRGLLLGDGHGGYCLCSFTVGPSRAGFRDLVAYRLLPTGCHS